MLTTSVTHPAVGLMSLAPSLALALALHMFWTSATGPQEPWGLGLHGGRGQVSKAS